MKYQLNEQLLAAIKERLPQDTDVVSVLMEIFPYMGKQSVYRRIRQEVPFLFEEAVKISRKLDISIDKIIGMVDANQAVFNYSEFATDLYMTYGEVMERYVQLVHRMGQSQNYKVRFATNSLPLILYGRHEYLSRFRLYKWIYQTKNDPELTFSKIVIPPALATIHKNAVLEVNNLKSLHMIIDSNLFLSIIDEIRFFYKRNLITKEEMQPLKEELLLILDHIGQLAATGVNDNGNSEVSIFLSSVNLDAAYTYLESDNLILSRIRMHTIEGIETQNPGFCKKQKQWIETLKKFSIMISQSGEIERIRFFNKQRELINSIDDLS